MTRPARARHDYETELDALGDLLHPVHVDDEDDAPNVDEAAKDEADDVDEAAKDEADDVDEAAKDDAGDVDEAAQDEGRDDAEEAPDADDPAHKGDESRGDAGSVAPEADAPEPSREGTRADPGDLGGTALQRPLGAPAIRDATTHAPAPLVPTEPSLGLSDILQRDAVLNVPKWRAARAAIAGAGLFGLLLAVIGAARFRAGVDVPVMGPLRIGHLGIILAVLSVIAFMAVRTVGGDSVLRIPLAPSQSDQWEEVQSQARLLQFGQWIGMGGAIVGMGVLGLSLRYLDGAGVVLGAGIGGALAVGSLALVGFMEARRGPLRAVYVQTMLLSRLEEAGVSNRLALDPRTAHVLQSLDHLLADLPESSVRRFLSSPEAQWYLDLIEKARGGPDERP